MSGLAPEGVIELEGSTEESNTDGIAFTVTVTGGAAEATVSLERTSEEYRVGERPELRKPEASASAPKGKPKAPKLDVGQEAIKAAFEGHGRLMVSVSRSADVLECVKLCNSYGIKPVLVSGSGAGAVAAQLKGKVTGVLVSSLTTARSLSQAGVPVAFGSGAEEGAADLPGYVASGIRSGLSPAVVVRSLTGDAADILGVSDRVGRIAPGMDGDILFLGASPLSAASGSAPASPAPRACLPRPLPPSPRQVLGEDFALEMPVFARFSGIKFTHGVITKVLTSSKDNTAKVWNATFEKKKEILVNLAWTVLKIVSMKI